MNSFSPFLGKWAWEDDKEFKRCIEFSCNFESNRLVLKVISQGNYLWEAENLTLKHVNEDGTNVYFFNNNWISDDGNKMFSMEAEYVEGKQEGTFVNVQEITRINDDKLKHVLLGYQFDPEKEEWLPFRVETHLNRLND